MRRENLGTHRIVKLPPARFPDADPIVHAQHAQAAARAPADQVDVLLVNPPSPDGGIWIRSQHRVGRRSRENMIWPQVSLAQLAALLAPDYSVEIIDAIALRLDWPAFEQRLRARPPRYYLTQVTAPTLTNDMYGVFLAKSLGAVTLGFGTHVTPMPRETMRSFPALDFVLRGEPELTLRELIDTLETAQGRWQVTDSGRLIGGDAGDEPEGHATIWKMWRDADPSWQPAWLQTTAGQGNGAGTATRIRRGCSYHGLAFNVAMDLEPFRRINPCGFRGLEVTDLRTLGVSLELHGAAELLAPHLLSALGMPADATWA